jgi:hypothetical protein
VLVGLVLASLLLAGIFGLAPLSLRHAEVLNPETWLVLRSRVAAIEKTVLPETLAVTVGFSTAREGIDRTIFRDSSGLDLLNLASSGGSFSELHSYYDFVLDSRLKPRVLIVAVHPCWLSGRLLTDVSAAEASSPAMLQRNWLQRVESSATIALDYPVWILANRARVNVLLRSALARARTSVANLLGIDALGLAPNLEFDPWKTTVLYSDRHAPEGQLARQIVQWRGFGWFDARQFSADSVEAAMLADFLRRAGRFSAHTIVVLMPESTVLRENVPVEAGTLLKDVVASTPGKFSLLDLRAALPDELFYDHAHLNGAGRDRFSRLIGQEVSRLFTNPE